MSCNSQLHVDATEATLGEVCLRITDGKHGDCENDDNSGYYFLSCKDVRDGKLYYEGARQITEQDFQDSHRRTQLEPSDILVTNSGTIGRLAMAPDTGLTKRTTFQKSVGILKPDRKSVDPVWLYYYLMSEVDRLIAFAGGTAQKNLLLRDMRAFEVVIPPLPTQRRIASILSPYDDLIENNTRRIAILEEMARRLYEEWFVHFRFPGYEGVKMVESEIGEVPDGWEVKRLDELATVNAQSINVNQAPEQINYIDIRSVTTGTMEEPRALPFAEAPSRARRIVRSGDILWSSVRPNLRAYVLVIDPKPNTIASTGFAVITPDDAPFSFLYPALTSDQFVEYLVNHATGAAYPAVSQNDFKAARLVVPPSKLLKDYDQFAQRMFLLAQRLHLKNANLRAQRDLLLPKLISGEIDASEIGEPIVEAAAE